jgi:hypothetical protein
VPAGRTMYRRLRWSVEVARWTSPASKVSTVHDGEPFPCKPLLGYVPRCACRCALNHRRRDQPTGQCQPGGDEHGHAKPGDKGRIDGMYDGGARCGVGVGRDLNPSQPRTCASAGAARL